MPDQPLEERRKLAQQLRDLCRELVTADVDDEAFAAVREAIEPLHERLTGHPRLQLEPGLHTRDKAGSRRGREPLYDRDPLIGLSNPLAPPLRQVGDGDWEVTFSEAYAGHPDFVHGGFVSAIIDHVLGVASSQSGVATMTGTLTIRYRRPTPINTRLRCRGTVTQVEGRKVTCEATLEAEGEILVEGSGLYLRLDPDRY